MKPRALRKSYVKAMSWCPLYADLQFNQGIPALTEAAIRGIHRHEARVLWLAGKADKRVPEDDDTFREDLLQIVENDCYAHMWNEFEYELSFYVTTTGEVFHWFEDFFVDVNHPNVDVNSPNIALTGTIDRIGILPDEGVVLVEDMKTGLFVQDFVFERHAYVLYARTIYPQYKRFRFDYYYPKLNRRDSWLYFWKTNRTVIITDPDGNESVLKARGRDPLQKYILDEKKRIEAIPCEPQPGAHCDSMYGEPCAYKGSHCSLASHLPAVATNNLPDAAPSVAEILSLPLEQQPGASFLLLLKGGVQVNDIPRPLILQAWEGISQLKAGTKKVEDICKAHVKASEQPIHYNGKIYGMRPPETVHDKASVLTKLRANGYAMDQIAELISIKASDLKKKLPEGELRDNILKTCVSGGTPRWGEIKEEK